VRVRQAEGHPTASALLRGRVRLAVAAMFLLAGGLHFVATETEMRLMPDWLPAHRELIYLSGICEIAGAVGLLVPRTRRAAGWGLALLLVAVFPANVNQFVNNIQLGGVFNDRTFQVLRLPLQAPLIWLVLWCTAEPSNANPPTGNAPHSPSRSMSKKPD